MKPLLQGFSAFFSGLLVGWWTVALVTWLDYQNGYQPATFYKDTSAMLSKEERQQAREFGFEPDNEAKAALIASRNKVWAKQLETCGEQAAGESLYILRALVWTQDDKFAANDPNARLTGVSDLGHITRGLVQGDNLDCGALQGDAIAFLLSEQRLNKVFGAFGSQPAEPLPNQLKQIDKILLARTDAWLAKRKIVQACITLRDPEYFQCGGTPGILFAYRAALLGSVYCTERKTDPISVSQVNSAWELAISRSAFINEWQYKAAQAGALERLKARDCLDLPFWLVEFEY
jgi:hypothetical protein